MGIRVGFLTSLGFNVGDEFIREGIRYALDRSGLAYEPYYVNKHDSATLQQPVADEVRSVAHKFWDVDLFIQAGAPVYWQLGTSTSVACEWYSWFWEALVLTDNPPRPAPLFVNLGAGACQAWGDGPELFLGDAGCVAFARRAAARSRLTTVRDPLAARLLTYLEIQHRVLPCPALLAAGRHPGGAPVPGLIGVNFMPLAAHYDLRKDFDRVAWADTVAKLVTQLRSTGTLLFICHDAEEGEFARQFARIGERIFQAGNWQECLAVYALCETVVANRVHGAVGAAGYGVPAIIIGNDTRAEIGDYVGLPRFHAVGLDVAAVTARHRELIRDRARESRRLLALREQTARDYQQLLALLLAEVSARA